MQNGDPPSRHQDDDHDDYLRRFYGPPEPEGVFFLILRVVAACFLPLYWLMRCLRWLFHCLLRWAGWLLDNPIGRAMKGCVEFPVMVGVLLYVELLKRLNPRIIRMTEKGEGSQTITWPGWFLFENAMKSKVRMCAGDGRGEVPKKLRGRGMVLRPGQKRKIHFPDESFYDIEVYGMDGQRLEQMKLRIAIPYTLD